MSTFNAINLLPQDDQIEAEEHTRELQIEEGFRVYQEALLLLNDKKFDESYEKFEELFELDVIRPDKWGIYRYSSPTLDRLRYLAYRNRGMYYYAFLLEKHPSMESSDIVNCILKVVENLIEALQHDDPDISVTKLLVQLFRGFKSKKLERLILENELTKEDNHLLLVGRRKKKLLPQFESIVCQYCSLLKEINDEDPIDFILSKIPTNSSLDNLSNQSNTFELNPILDKIKKMKTEDENLMKKLDTFEVNIENLDWETVAQSLSDILPSTKIANLLGKNSDPYNEFEDPLESVEFVIKNSSKNSIKEKTNVISCTADQDDPNHIGKDLKDENNSNNNNNNDNDENIDDAVDMNIIEDNKTLKRPAEIDTAASRVVQRSSKRFKEKGEATEEINSVLSVEMHEAFLIQFDSQLSRLGYKLPITIDRLSKNCVYSNNDMLVYRDLYDCLNNWSSWHTEIFTQINVGNKANNNQKDNREEIFQLNLLLRTNILEEKNELSDTVEELPSNTVDEFVKNVNILKPHFHELRFLFLKSILDNDGKQRFVTKYVLPDCLMKITVAFVLGIEGNLYDFVLNNNDKYWLFGLSILEILVNLLGDICEEMSSKKPQNNRVNDLKSQRNKLERKIKRWLQLLDQIKKSLTNRYNDLSYEWIKYCYIQMTNEITDNMLLQSLESISHILKDIKGEVNICFPNYRHIPTLTSNSVKSQLSKINIIRNISLLDPDDTGNIATNNIESENLKHMTLLENILMKGLYPTDSSIDYVNPEMVEFISESPFQLKVKLWGVLFSYYYNLNDVNTGLKVYFNYLHLLNNKISAGSYISESEDVRKRTLLLILSTVGHTTLKILKLLRDSGWQEPKVRLEHKKIKEVYELFLILYAILYYETIAKTDDSLISFSRKATKSYALVKDYFVALATLLSYLFCWECHQKEVTSYGDMTVSFISCLHSFLGDMSFCDAADGYFLILSETFLCRWVSDASYAPFKQVLWCRYHYLLATDNTTPEQHETQITAMQKVNAIPLGIYLMKYQYRDTNPLLTPNSKTSLKLVLDNIIETVGDPSTVDNHILARNGYLLDEYLNRAVTVSSLKSALNGEPLLTLTTPNDDLQEGMDTGIFYVASIQAMNLYKTRKKSMQARPSELDSIRKTLRNDILYNTRRFESWYLLGKCFSYIVEDDLIWTSDKISVIDKKRTIAVTQRKAILCYIMSLSLYYSIECPSPEDGKIIEQTFEALGKELISGFYKPMDKLCFSWKSSNKILEISDTKDIQETNSTEFITISDFNIEQAIVLCFARANEFINISGKNNWSNDYQLGRMLFKMDKILYWKQAFDYIKRSAIACAKVSSSKEPVIEPHYFLINICYKMTSLDIISPKDALSMISEDKDYLIREDTFWEIEKSDNPIKDKELFYRKIIDLLRYLISQDKRKMQHRPQFRIAKILYDEFQDISAALDEIEGMVSIKNTKNLINIWKPDNERPGKHFVYAYQYIIFYIKLQFKMKDFNSIAIVVKKIRRFGAGIAYVNEATEFAIKSYNETIDTKLGITDKKYVENLLPSLNYQHFLKVSQKLHDEFKVDEYSPEYIEGLRYAFQLKRGNNGIAFDSACLSLYFKCFYLPKLELEEVRDLESKPINENNFDVSILSAQISDTSSNTESKLLNSPKQNAIRKRVSKKEAFDRIRSLVDRFP